MYLLTKIHTGHGTFAKEDFSQCQFLLEYKGELIDRKEGEKRERLYPQSVRSFLYFFRHTQKRKTYW